MQLNMFINSEYCRTAYVKSEPRKNVSDGRPTEKNGWQQTGSPLRRVSINLRRRYPIHSPYSPLAMESVANVRYLQLHPTLPPPGKRPCRGVSRRSSDGTNFAYTCLRLKANCHAVESIRLGLRQTAGQQPSSEKLDISWIWAARRSRSASGSLRQRHNVFYACDAPTVAVDYPDDEDGERTKLCRRELIGERIMQQTGRETCWIKVALTTGSCAFHKASAWIHPVYNTVYVTPPPPRGRQRIRKDATSSSATVAALMRGFVPHGSRFPLASVI